MIIVKFQGALGNQMFEYAFLQRLKKEYPGNDIRGYIPHIKDFNGYEVENIFDLNIPKAHPLTIAKLSNIYPDNAPLSAIFKPIRSYKWIMYGGKSSHLRVDDNTYYYPEVFNLNPLKSYFLDGVWANAKYLEGIEDEIKKAFVFPNNRGSKNDEYLRQINSSESVCIHVRRNEYVKMGLSVASDQYYQKAISYISKMVPNPSFFIFSDDHEYCRKLFDGKIKYTIVEGNTSDKSFRDMELMSYCKHNIIANSTFSFWGAYLNSNNNKIVIAPNVSWGNLRCPFVCSDWILFDI